MHQYKYIHCATEQIRIKQNIFKR